MRKRLLRTLPLAAAAAFASGLLAQEPQTTVTVSGAGAFTSGDSGRRDDQEGYRSGVGLAVDTRRDGFHLALDFAPTTAGWLDLELNASSPWRFSLHVDRTRRYSDDSIRPELTPLGTPVSSFFPGTNTLFPAFGDVDPVLTRHRFRARLAYLLPNGSIDVSARGVVLRGDKVPEAGGITFGDNGAPAFFVPGLEHQDTTESEVSLGARLNALGLDWNVRLARGKRDGESTTSFPTFGVNRLIDISNYTEGHDATFTTASLAAAFERRTFTLVGGVGYQKVSSTPSFNGGVAGATPTDTLQNGSVEAKRKTAAASARANPVESVTFRVAGRATREDESASGSEPFRGRTMDLTRTDEIESWRAEAELRYAHEGFGAALLGSRDRRTDEIARLRTPMVQLQDDRTTRDLLRGEASYRVSGKFRSRAFLERRWDDVDVDLHELLLGYATGNRENRITRLGVAASGTFGGVELGVDLQGADGTADLDPPYFDPVFDPSQVLTKARGRTRTRSYLAHAASAGGSPFQVWGDLGWREESWAFDDTVTFPGFAPVDEEVSGLTASVGATWVPSVAWRATVSGWLDAPSHTVAHRAYRLEAGVEREITKSWSARLGVLHRRFSESLYHLDDYTLTSVSAGVSGRF